MQLHRENPEREIWLVEDNAPSHRRAANLDSLSGELTEEWIFRCNWPPNSPDLNTIEAVWDDFKVQPQTPLAVPATNVWQNNVENRGPYKGKSQVEIARVKGILEEEWNGMSGGKVSRRCASFRRRLEQVRDNAG